MRRICRRRGYPSYPRLLERETGMHLRQSRILLKIGSLLEDKRMVITHRPESSIEGSGAEGKKQGLLPAGNVDRPDHLGLDAGLPHRRPDRPVAIVLCHAEPVDHRHAASELATGFDIGVV